MPNTASDLLIGRLIDWGVDTVFGLPGDGIDGIMEALRKKRVGVTLFRDVVHETDFAAAASGVLGEVKEKIGGLVGRDDSHSE